MYLGINHKEDFIILHQPAKVDTIKAKNNRFGIVQSEKHRDKPLNFKYRSRAALSNTCKESKEAPLEKVY